MPTTIDAELAARQAVWEMYEWCAVAKYLLEIERPTVVARRDAGRGVLMLRPDSDLGALTVYAASQVRPE